MKQSKTLFLLVAIFAVLLGFTSIAEAVEHQYAQSYQNNHSYRGIKAGFKIPNIDSKWANNNGRFITFEQWIVVNQYGNWFEMGYMDGSMDPENDGIAYDYRGCFKAKYINAAYVEWPLSKTVAVGERHAFEIADANNDNIWDILINSTSYGTFSNQVPPVDAGENQMGFEYNPVAGEAPVFSATDINSQYYRSQGVWKAWNNGLIGVWVYDDLPYLTTTWNSGGNSTTFQLQ